MLSLFFIDEVSKYRLYDGDNDDGRNGEYAKMFEEEYENVVGQMQRQFGDDAYLHYLDGIDAQDPPGVFFYRQKKGKKPALWKERSTAKRSCPMMWMPTT